MKPATVGTIGAVLALTLVAAAARAQSRYPVVTVRGEPPAWHLEKLATILSPDGVGFTRAITALIDPKGGVIVLDPHERTLYRFDDSGKFLGTIGRVGSGPSEFRVPEAIGWLGDELIVYDPENARILRWGRDAAFRGEWRLTGPVLTGDLPLFAGLGGTLWLYQGGLGPSGKYQSNFIRFPPTGHDDTLWLAPHKQIESTGPPKGHDGYVVCVEPNGFTWFDSPFWNAPSKRVVTPQGDLLQTTGPDYRLVVTNAAGDTVKALVHDVTRAPISDAEWNAGIADYKGWLPKHPGASCSGGESRASAKPAIRDLATDDSGRVWVERYMETGYRWEAWQGDRIVGAFDVADTATNIKVDFRGDRVTFLRYHEEDGGQDVLLYRIHR